MSQNSKSSVDTIVQNKRKTRGKGAPLSSKTLVQDKSSAKSVSPISTKSKAITKGRPSKIPFWNEVKAAFLAGDLGRDTDEMLSKGFIAKVEEIVGSYENAKAAARSLKKGKYVPAIKDKTVIALQEEEEKRSVVAVEEATESAVWSDAPIDQTIQDHTQQQMGVAEEYPYTPGMELKPQPQKPV